MYLAWRSEDFCDNSPMWQDKCLISLAAWFNLYSELGLWLSKIYGYFLASCVLAWFFPFFGIFAFFIWSVLARILELYQKLEALCLYVRLIKSTFMKPKVRFCSYTMVKKYFSINYFTDYWFNLAQEPKFVLGFDRLQEF